MALACFCLLTSCGGGKDYSSNVYIGESTTYYQLLKMENYFIFKKDGTGKLQLDRFTYDLVFEMINDTTASVEWDGMKMGTGTFSTTTASGTAKKSFQWSRKTFTVL